MRQTPSQPAQKRKTIVLMGLFFLVLFSSLSPQTADAGVFCTDSTVSGTFIEWTPGPNLPDDNNLCLGLFHCEQAVNNGISYEVVPPGCDASAKTCALRLNVALEMPGLHQEFNIFAPAQFFWFQGPTPTVPCNPGCDPAPISTCGLFGGGIDEDTGQAFIQVSDLTCDTLDQPEHQLYSLSVYRCKGATGCERRLDVPSLSLTAQTLKRELGCKDPPPAGCGGDLGCKMCNSCGPGGAASPSGNGGAFSGGGKGNTGPGAELRYLAGGAGGDGWPGTAAWRTELGLYWSHDYAERIIEDAANSRAWLITKFSTFRKFSNLSGGVYQTNSPSDEYRTLSKTAGGWELESLDGTIQAFNSLGRWISTTDRFGNAKNAFYNAMGQLEIVTFPDDRSETFSYYPTGKLRTITEVGVTAMDSRTWTYTWTDDLLDRIDHPDGTALEFFYEDLNFLGYLTRVEKVGTLGGRRVESSWEYDAVGNVAYLWRGDADRLGANAIDLWEYVFDNPVSPTVTTVIDPLGNSATHTIGRDENSNKPRLEGLDGDCPSCGTGPNTTIAYDDMDHPLRATKETDANGHETVMTYDANGQVLTRTEALGEPEERTTTWVYNTTFPALVDRIIQESVEGAPNERITAMTYNSEGALTQRRIEGFESIDGLVTSFSLPTNYTPSPEGQTLAIDPPGYSTDDVTTFIYDPARGSLLAESRTDPLVGTTFFTYDDYNRRTEIMDPNGAKTETTFDDANRVLSVIQHGAPDPVASSSPSLLGATHSQPTTPGAGPGRARAQTQRRPAAAREAAEMSGQLSEAGPGRVLPAPRHPDADAGSRAAAAKRSPARASGPSNHAGPSTLTTTNEYNEFGDLFRTTQPKGNIIEYTYDFAGRLISIERKPDASTPKERTFYILDAIGNRIREDLQRWDGAAWENRSTTEFTYTNRCQLDKVLYPGGSATEYAYDCEGNLEKIWDANHPSLGQTEIPSTMYTYDALDRLTQVSQRWGGTGGGLATTQYLYDVQDHLTQVIDAEDTPTVYKYSDRDLLTQETSIVSGSTDHKYNEHGELIETKDARQIVTTRRLDELDRVTEVSYPTTNLNTTYTYDDPAVDFSKGRLTQISRHSSDIDYAYDRFGRLTQDGDLTFGYDDNGNRANIGYPGGVMANYTHDFADRELTLEVDRSGQPTQPIASGASYEPSGPLASLTLGNGLTETRGFNQRYFPTHIDLAGASTLLDWTYATDNVGNILSITDNQTPANNRGYAYQDFQYFLTSGTGPWGTRTWTYDQIGNRLSEVRDALPQEDYVYLQNGSGKNTAVLDEIQINGVTLRDYQYGIAGHLERVTAGANEILYTSDAEGRLATITRQAGDARTDFLYDGRSFLTLSAANTATGIFADDFETGDIRCWTASVGGDPGPGPIKCDPQPLTRPTYSSDGLLMAVSKDESQATELAKTYLYFAGRPVAQLSVDSGGSASSTWLTTDHLGTPVVATNDAGVEGWSGGFEPFGGDFSAASDSDVDLRFPGQWDDSSWKESNFGSEQYYNVHRWYLTGAGRYEKSDPLGLSADINLMSYARSNPAVFVDSLGLAVQVCCKKIPFTFGRLHCYVKILKGEGTAPQVWTWGLHPPNRDRTLRGARKSRRCATSSIIASVESNDWFDLSKDHPDTHCGPVQEDPCLDKERCVDREALAYPQVTTYCLFGPNSNTFAATLTNRCGLQPPSAARAYKAPGWNDSPPRQ
ncbi:MAG: hypothetical protein K0U98_27080 [Deltaproteobacteria bacterium]|nr:hypothetical protein [Deltaproteobacteria bacterium]